MVRVCLSKSDPYHFSIQPYASIDNGIIVKWIEMLGDFPLKQHVKLSGDSACIQVNQYDSFAFMFASWISIAYSNSAIRMLNVILSLCPGQSKIRHMDPIPKVRVTDATKHVSPDPNVPFLIGTHFFRGKISRKDDRIFFVDYEYMPAVFEKYKPLIEYAMELEKENYYAISFLNILVIELEEYVEHWEILSPLFKALAALNQSPDSQSLNNSGTHKAQIKIAYRQTYEHT